MCCVCLVTKLCPTLATPWTVASQAPLPTGFSRKEHWSRLPFPSPGDLPNPGIKRRSPASQADSLLTKLKEAPLAMGFSRQEYWIWLPFSSPGRLPDPGIELEAPALQADSLPTELPGNSLSIKLLPPNFQRGE